MTTLVTWMRSDPRFFQLIAQSFIITYASLFLEHSFSWMGAAALFLSGVFFSRLIARPDLLNFSFFNTTLSAMILIRCENLWPWMAMGVFTMIAKLLAKKRGHHIFNPSNFALVLGLILFSDSVWIDPGLWAQDGLMIVFCLVMGVFVTAKAKVLGASLTFLLFIILFEVVRALGLGDPISIPLHNLQNGGLFIFSFFTLSDPKTAPRTLALQMIYAIFISALSFSLSYALFVRGPWFYSLFLVNMIMPQFLNLFKRDQPSEYLWKRLPLAS